jgi:hypothetical protein
MGSDSDLDEPNDSKSILDPKPDVFSAEAWVTQFQEVSNEWKGNREERSVQLAKMLFHCHPNQEDLSKFLTENQVCFKHVKSLFGHSMCNLSGFRRLYKNLEKVCIRSGQSRTVQEECSAPH